MFLDSWKSLSALAGAPLFLPCRFGVHTKSAHNLISRYADSSLFGMYLLFRTTPSGPRFIKFAIGWRDSCHTYRRYVAPPPHPHRWVPIFDELEGLRDADCLAMSEFWQTSDTSPLSRSTLMFLHQNWSNLQSGTRVHPITRRSLC